MSPEELFKKNEGLVFHVVNRIIRQNRNDITIIDREDMEQMGRIGLWKACKNFKPELGWKFASYAVPSITGEIVNSTRENYAHIRVPRKSKQISKKLKKITNNGGEIPTVKEIQKGFDCSEEDARISIELANMELMSIDYTAYRNESSFFGRKTSIAETISDERSNFENDIIKKDELIRKLALLNDKEYRIIILSLQGKTQTQIGKMFGVSQKTIWKYTKRAVEKMQNYGEVLVNENEPQLT